MASSSSATNVELIGEDHYQALVAAQEVLTAAKELERMVALVGEGELSKENREIYRRAQLLKAYMTQPFASTEAQTGVKGEYVSRAQTIADVADILAGKHDDKQAQDVWMKGAL